MLHEKSNITATFAEHLKFKRINAFYTYTLDKNVELNAQEAQVKEFNNRLSSLNFFFAKTLTSAASSSYVEEVDESLLKSKIYLSVPADSVKKQRQ